MFLLWFSKFQKLLSPKPSLIGHCFNQWDLFFSVYNPVRLYLHFILMMSLEECQTKSFGMNLLLHAIFKKLSWFYSNRMYGKIWSTLSGKVQDCIRIWSENKVISNFTWVESMIIKTNVSLSKIIAFYNSSMKWYHFLLVLGIKIVCLHSIKVLLVSCSWILIFYFQFFKPEKIKR